MDRNLFAYIWRHSRRDQIAIFALVAGSLPFYFLSLELPKRIINEAIQGRAFEGGRTTATFLDLRIEWPSFLGGGETSLFAGFPLPRLDYLYALSGLFLAFVLINGGFKYIINLLKGALGERMLRRLRFDLFSAFLRFRPEAIRAVKPAEAATIIKDEVEPIGGFIGDAFVQPVFLGGQALTALTFILMQNLWLGVMAGSIVGVQALIIPKLRREQIRLGQLRQIASRRLAGRVGEVVDGMSAIRTHGTLAYEQAEVATRLGELFSIRFKLFKRKFAVKFLNNLLAQVTPFLFYAVGGYFALRGSLDIGQLIAVIGAYRDLPPPVKELIDWDQQRLDVGVKYDQIVEQISPEQFEELDGSGIDPERRLNEGRLEFRNVAYVDQRGVNLLDPLTLSLPLPVRLGLAGGPGSGASILARILGRDLSNVTGTVQAAGIPLLGLPHEIAGRKLGFVGSDPVVFPGSVRDNVLYPLKRRRPSPRSGGDPVEAERRREAKRTGNPVEDIHADWIDYEAAGVAGPSEIDERVTEMLRLVGLDEDVYRFGLGGSVDPERFPRLAERIVEARTAVREAMAATNLTRLVTPFDPNRYNDNATFGENVLFGVPLDDTFREQNLSKNPFVRSILEAEGLTRPLSDMGFRIAETMVEIFSGVSSGQSLFERFSFISAEDLPVYADIVARWKTRRRGPETAQDRDALIALPFIYIEPRHRLGLMTDELRAGAVRARHSFAELMPPGLKRSVEFYDPDGLNAAAPLRDNLLFGRIAYGYADAGEEVEGVMRRVLRDLDLDREVYRLGQEHQVGPMGRLLFSTQKTALNLAACLIKRPDMLVLQDALSNYAEPDRLTLLARIGEAIGDGVLVSTVSTPAEEALFNEVLAFDGPRLRHSPEARDSSDVQLARAAE